MNFLIQSHVDRVVVLLAFFIITTLGVVKRGSDLGQNEKCRLCAKKKILYLNGALLASGVPVPSPLASEVTAELVLVDVEGGEEEPGRPVVLLTRLGRGDQDDTDGVGVDHITSEV